MNKIDTDVTSSPYADKSSVLLALAGGTFLRWEFDQLCTRGRRGISLHGLPFHYTRWRNACCISVAPHGFGGISISILNIW